MRFLKYSWPAQVRIRFPELYELHVRCASFKTEEVRLHLLYFDLSFLDSLSLSLLFEIVDFTQRPPDFVAILQYLEELFVFKRY